MAKTTKTTTDKATAGDTEAAKSKKTPAKKAVAKKPATGAASASGIDTTLAAQDAARMLLAKAKGLTGGPAGGKSSAAFEQLKQSAGKPTLEGVLKGGHDIGQKKQVVGHQKDRQTGRNQTSGGEPHRFVPRRSGVS